MIKATSFFILVLLSLSACYYDNKEDLYIILSSGECDTVAVNYTQTVQPLLDAQCVSCHQAGNSSGNVLLDSYASAKQYAENGRLMGSVKHESGYSSMPPGGSLSDCDIAKLEAWVAAGSPEN